MRIRKGTRRLVTATMIAELQSRGWDVEEADEDKLVGDFWAAFKRALNTYAMAGSTVQVGAEEEEEEQGTFPVSVDDVAGYAERSG